MHFYSYKEDIVNTTKNKQFFHTMENQYICYKSVPSHIMLMNPTLTVHLSAEDLKLDNSIMQEVLLNLVLLSI